LRVSRPTTRKSFRLMFVVGCLSDTYIHEGETPTPPVISSRQRRLSTSSYTTQGIYQTSPVIRPLPAISFVVYAPSRSASTLDRTRRQPIRLEKGTTATDGGTQVGGDYTEER
jgi:hypothetical protein